MTSGMLFLFNKLVNQFTWIFQQLINNQIFILLTKEILILILIALKCPEPETISNKQS